MIQTIFLLLLGIGGSILALVIACAFLTQAFRNRSERTCLLEEYSNWVMSKGNEEQKRLAYQLKKSRNLEALRRLVGFGMLVDR